MPFHSVMIADTPSRFLSAYGDGSSFPPDLEPAVPRAVMLVSPHGFRVSEESSGDNHYMQLGSRVDPERAFAQHAGVADTIMRLGPPVIYFSGRPGFDDGIYPNNAFGTVRGRLVVGHMRHGVRQEETRRQDIRSFFTDTLGYEIRDLSEQSGIAELTGALVIDRARGIGLCGLSGRADKEGCAAMHEAFELRLSFCFDLDPQEYHTNIVLAVPAGRACLIHAASFVDPEAAAAIATVYEGRTILLTDEEKEHFAGNCLAITEQDLLFSQTALDALLPTSRGKLEELGFRLHGAQIDELEKGGGSLRCLLAEVF